MARFIIPPQPIRPKGPNSFIYNTGPGSGLAPPPPPKYPTPGGTRVTPRMGNFGPGSGGAAPPPPKYPIRGGTSGITRFTPNRWGGTLGQPQQLPSFAGASGVTPPIRQYGHRPGAYDNWVSPQEHVDNLISRFNAQPLTYKTVGGKIIATRSMAKEKRPQSIGGTAFAHLYGTGDLTSQFVLPGDAFTGPTNLQRQAPLSDAARAGAYGAGLGGMVNPNVSSLNPNTYWPSSAFNLPMGANGMPGFGTVDYTTGRFNMPVWSGVEPYGRFDTRFKRPPTLSRRRY